MATPNVVNPKILTTFDTLQNIIIDVRTHGEYTAKHLAIPHVLAPLEGINPEALMLKQGINKQTPLYFLCQSGNRAKKAAELFSNAGFSTVYIIEGGILACLKENIPVAGTTANAPVSTVMPIERQVRIAAGSLVTLFTILSGLIHPIFCVGTLLVGCGLIYAGVTNWCGLMLLLLQAPWNKKAGASCATGSCSTASSPSQGKGCQ